MTSKNESTKIASVVASATADHHLHRRRKSSVPLIKYPDPESLLQVRSKFDDLKDFVENIHVKLNSLYNYNEKEFLATYRVHTLDLQSEIKYLKEKVKVAEDILNDDTTVSSLEREANWFRDEVERLQGQLESMGRDFEVLTERTEVLCDQRSYLTDQLKNVVKKYRCCQVSGDEFAVIDEFV